MICNCGDLSIAFRPDDKAVDVFLSKGTAIIRPTGEFLRVEHFECGHCRGYIVRDPKPGALRGDCGCL